MKAIVCNLFGRTTFYFRFVIVLITLPQPGFGQVSNYAFTETTGTYQAILGNTTLGGTSGTLNGSGNASSTTTHMILPFSFCMGGQTYPSGTRISMDANGWIAFGNPVISAATRVAPLTNFNNCISAFGIGLRTTGTSSLSIRIIGTSPNRVIVFQWGQSYFGNSGGSSGTSNNYWRRVVVPNVNGASTGDDTPGNNDRLHFQIRLYETTHVIEFHYCITDAPNTVPGNRHGGITDNVQVGLRGTTSSDFNVRTKSSTSTPWNNNTTAGAALPVSNTNTVTFNNQRAVAANRPSAVTPANPGSANTTAGTAGPGTGTIFRWTPLAVAGASMDAVGCFSLPLPVELTDFGVNTHETSNYIYWSTASEVNSDYFHVERSVNGGEWDIVGYVQSAGNSSTTLDYQLEDRGFEPTINYYRLKQVDFDGTTKYYNIVSVDNRTSKSELIKTVNTMGQEVTNYYKGLVIEIYSDGSTQKYYRH
jgi:hypothetical protein